jgi:hypothetical protein
LLPTPGGKPRAAPAARVVPAGRPLPQPRGAQGKKIIVQKKLFLLTAKKFLFGDLHVSWSSLHPDSGEKEKGHALSDVA